MRQITQQFMRQITQQFMGQITQQFMRQIRQQFMLMATQLYFIFEINVQLKLTWSFEWNFATINAVYKKTLSI